MAVFLNLEEFGQPAIYTPSSGGSQMRGTVMLEEGNSLDPGAMGTNPAEVGRMLINLADFPDPQIDDVFTLSRGDWRVVREISRDQVSVVLEVIRGGRASLK